MLVSGVNRILNWCSVVSSGRTYTCITKKIDGKLFFRFKKGWHPVAMYLAEHVDELVEENGKIFSRPFVDGI